MPRRARIVLDDTPVHLIQRGNNRSPCFFSEGDYRYYLNLLGEACREEEVLVHAYVLMTNHVHLLVTPRQAEGPSRVMKRLGQRYVQHVNRVYRRSGSMWEGRFRSCLVQEEPYLLSCYRYIELNPLRAGMVAHPAEYPWSSYRANARGETDSLLTPHPLYQTLGTDAAARQAAYRDLADGGLDARQIENIRSSTNGGFVLGQQAFQRQIAERVGRRTWKGAAGRPRTGGPGNAGVRK